MTEDAAGAGGSPGSGDGVRRALLLWGGIEGAALAALGWWPGVPFPFPGLLLYLTAFGAYLLAARAVLRSGRGEAGRDRRTLLVVGGLALLFRAILLPLAPELSDDVWRYLWDGHVQLQGVNPYLRAPSAPELESLRTGWHHLINHPDVPTIYPPLAQMAFVVVALAGSTVTSAKLLWLVLDAACALLLVRVARDTGRPVLPVALLYLWSPLLVVETAWSAHLEVLGLAALALILHLDVRRRRAGTGVAAALATAVKFAPAAALPPLLRRSGWRLGLAFAAALLLLHLPYADAGTRLWTGLGTYVESWRFNDGGFWLLAAILPSLDAAKIGAGAVVLAVVAWTTLRGVGAESALFWILGTGLVLSPTVHPWYVLWILPFAALRASRPWILLTGLAPLAYYGLGSYLETGVWLHPAWLRIVIWAPFFALLAFDGLRRLRDDVAPPARRPPHPSTR